MDEDRLIAHSHEICDVSPVLHAAGSLHFLDVFELCQISGEGHIGRRIVNAQKCEAGSERIVTIGGIVVVIWGLLFLSIFEDISALRLEYAMAMSGVASVESAITPEVRITAFSVDKGVDIAVDMPTTINPSTLKATNIGTVNVPVTLKLWKTDSLDGTWTEIGSVSETFAVNTVNGKLDQAKLDALNASLKAQLSGQSGFFKVTVE